MTSLGPSVSIPSVKGRDWVSPGILKVHSLASMLVLALVALEKKYKWITLRVELCPSERYAGVLIPGI